MVCRHQISDCLRAIALQLRLFFGRDGLQVTRDLVKVRCDKNESFALRAHLDFKQAPNCIAIIRVATEAIAGLGGIGDQAATLQMRGDVARRCGETEQLLS